MSASARASKPPFVGSAVETTTREAAHRARLAPYVEPHLARRRDGVKHPVHDFLFTYYSFSPAKLTAWHPGWPESGTREQLDRLRPLVRATRSLLVATMSRPAHTGCFGLHEWAMVHRTDATRHEVPLRLGASATDEVVESHRIACSHFDAYRFFTRRPRRSTPCPLAATTGRRTSSRAACTRRWTSTSTPSGSRRWSPPTSSPTASCWRGTSARSTCAPRPTTSRPHARANG